MKSRSLSDLDPCKSANIGLLLRAGLCAALLQGSVSCDTAPGQDAATKGPHAPVPESTHGLVRLSAEEITRGGIEVQPVGRAEFRTHRDFPGTVAPDANSLAEITTLARGRVIDVYADLGNEVKAGSLLAILYSSELGMAQSAYLKAKAKLHVADQASKRARLLLQEKVIGKAEAERREGERISALAEDREARDRLELLGMTDKEILQFERDHIIRSYIPIHAPFAGRVIARNLTKGEVVEITEKLFVVADLSEVWVKANIPEKDIPYIHTDQSDRDQSAEVRVSAYPNEVFHGRITYVGDVLDPATRTMRLRLELQNPHRKLKPEMFATIRIYSEPETNVLLVPEGSIQRERERRFVFVQREPQVFEARDVKLGDSNGEVIKVLDGLQEGEQIVTKGSFVLKSELLGEQI